MDNMSSLGWKNASIPHNRVFVAHIRRDLGDITVLRQISVPNTDIFRNFQTWNVSIYLKKIEVVDLLLMKSWRKSEKLKNFELEKESI